MSPRTCCAFNGGLAFLLCVGAVAGEPAAGRNEQLKSPRVVKLILSAASEPTPALKYTLLPDYMQQRPGNAVQLMYVAAELVSNLSEETDSQQLYENLTDWVNLPPDKRPANEVRKLLQEAALSIHYAELAARRTYAEWDIPARHEGFSAVLPSFRTYRMISRLLSLRIDVALAESRYEDALADLKTGFALARWCAGPTLIQDLVTVSNLSVMTESVEAWIGRADSANLYWALVNLPNPMIDVREAYEFERNVVFAEIPQLLTIPTEVFSAEQADSLVRTLVELKRAYSPGKDETAGPWERFESAQPYLSQQAPDSRKGLIAKGYDREKVQSMPPAQVVILERFIEFEALRDESFKLLNLPYWQAADKLRESQKRIESMVGEQTDKAFPFLELIPSLGRARFLLARMERNIAALQVIEAIRMHMAQTKSGLPETLVQINVVPLPSDPVTGKAFVYTPTACGATLVCPTPDPNSPQDGTRYELTAR